jgi:hypothetical protein
MDEILVDAGDLLQWLSGCIEKWDGENFDRWITYKGVYNEVARRVSEQRERKAGSDE